MARKEWAGFAFVGGLLGWFLLVSWQPTDVWVCLGYLCLSAALVGLVGIAGRAGSRWNLKSLSLIVGLFAAIAIFVFAARSDSYRETWKSDSGVRVTDRHYRWSGKLFYRTLSGDKFSASGPMTESEKRNGEWVFMDYAEGLNWRDRRSTIWYWYGEEISEGDWHAKK